jgi:hypothetical protein
LNLLVTLLTLLPIPTPTLSEIVLALETVADVEEPRADAERRGDEGRVRVRAQ